MKLAHTNRESTGCIDAMCYASIRAMAYIDWTLVDGLLRFQVTQSCVTGPHSVKLSQCS